ncbi:hypothetical protein CTAYLR_006961 [Chrysophaeum taylorii]|uniref:Metallo-beta-lactamase domain-containing protein n=1 Tax=Chrysophaeum taylorii TaxID=2483200 RepID=A0AAD7UFY8_9STRA|nr:hypothetical protein CTAYLR_006961 [Chrysophaeum taylorii]
MDPDVDVEQRHHQESTEESSSSSSSSQDAAGMFREYGEAMSRKARALAVEARAWVRRVQTVTSSFAVRCQLRTARLVAACQATTTTSARGAASACRGRKPKNDDDDDDDRPRWPSWQQTWRGAIAAGLVVIAVMQPINYAVERHRKRATKEREAKRAIRRAMSRQLPAWRFGMLDVHHVKAGMSQSTFVVLPDGTTALVDAGDQDPDKFEAQAPHVKVLRLPEGLETSGEAVAEYVKRFAPIERLDYAIITHFHPDHVGVAYPNSTSYALSGIAEIGSKLDIGKFLDRAYPDYQAPRDPIVDNYVRFVRDAIKHRGSKAERFAPGRSDQVKLLKCKKMARYKKTDEARRCSRLRRAFRFRNLKADAMVADRDGNVSAIGPLDARWDENRRSLAMVLEYGNFRYFTGGDNDVDRFSHLKREPTTEIDTTTAVARAAGEVDAATMNNHGLGVNRAFFEYLAPKVVVNQAWRSDQPSEDALYLISTDNIARDGLAAPQFFATWLAPERQATLHGLTSRRRDAPHFLDDARQGHVVVRAHPVPDHEDDTLPQLFSVFVLDETSFEVKLESGPYVAGQTTSQPPVLRRDPTYGRHSRLLGRSRFIVDEAEAFSSSSLSSSLGAYHGADRHSVYGD